MLPGPDAQLSNWAAAVRRRAGRAGEAAGAFFDELSPGGDRFFDLACAKLNLGTELCRRQAVGRSLFQAMDPLFGLGEFLALQQTLRVGCHVLWLVALRGQQGQQLTTGLGPIAHRQVKLRQEESVFGSGVDLVFSQLLVDPHGLAVLGKLGMRGEETGLQTQIIGRGRRSRQILIDQSNRFQKVRISSLIGANTGEVGARVSHLLGAPCTWPLTILRSCSAALSKSRCRM